MGYKYNIFAGKFDLVGASSSAAAVPPGGVGFTWNFDSSTVAADPGSGDFRLDTADFATLGFAYISKVDANTVTQSDFLALVALSKGMVKFYNESDPDNFVTCEVISATDNSGVDNFYTVGISKLASAGSFFTNTTAIIISFIPIGGIWGRINGLIDDQTDVAPRLLPAGGTTSQVLKKSTDSDYAVEWGTTGGGVAWGDITGTLSSQTDLNTALGGKQDVLTGLTPTVTELNYVDGVTSAIQTQLNAKAPAASPTFTGTVTLPSGLTGVIRADSGVVSTDTDVTDVVAAASDTAAGKVELATTAETETGTDTGRAVTPDGLHDMTTLAGAAWFLDEDTMSSDSATKTASQQSIKAYVDANIQGLNIKQSVKFATAAALPANTYLSGVLTASANGALSVDSVGVANGERILVKDESTGANNGIYVVTDLGSAGTPYILTRSSDMNVSSEVLSAFTFVEAGSTNVDSGWVCTTNASITLGTTSLAFSQFSGAGQITAGEALTKSGNVLDVAVDGSTIEVSTDALRVKDAGITTTKMGGDVTTAGKALLDDANAAAQLVTLGLTATATELNYTDGVTSAIQTQLDGKQATLTGLTSSVAELNILDGVTSTAAELNALDGITSTVTELNYTDGVTSAIQTQLDAKETKTANNILATFTALANQPPAASFATFDTRNSFPFLSFSGTVDAEAVFGGVFPNHYAGGGITVDLYIRFTSATTGTANVEVSLENDESLDIDSDSFATMTDVSVTPNATAGVVTIASINFADGSAMDSIGAGDEFRIKVRRDADGTNGTDDITTVMELYKVVIKEQ